MDDEERGEGGGRKQTRRMRGGVVVTRERSRGGCSLVPFVTSSLR